MKLPCSGCERRISARGCLRSGPIRKVGGTVHFRPIYEKCGGGGGG